MFSCLLPSLFLSSPLLSPDIDGKLNRVYPKDIMESEDGTYTMSYCPHCYHSNTTGSLHVLQQPAMNLEQSQVINNVSYWFLRCKEIIIIFLPLFFPFLSSSLPPSLSPSLSHQFHLLTVQPNQRVGAPACPLYQAPKKRRRGDPN